MDHNIRFIIDPQVCFFLFTRDYKSIKWMNQDYDCSLPVPELSSSSQLFVFPYSVLFNCFYFFLIILILVYIWYIKLPSTTFAAVELAPLKYGSDIPALPLETPSSSFLMCPEDMALPSDLETRLWYEKKKQMQ